MRLESFGLSLSIPSVPWIGPGQIPTTLIPLGPNSTAMCLVKASTPALADPEWLCRAVPLQCKLADMLRMTPLFFMLSSAVYFESRKVPTVSIIRTVLYALGERFSMVDKKLPAAPLTKISISPCFSRMSLMVAMISFQFLTSQELPHTFLLPVSSERVLTALLMFSILRLMMQTDAPCSKNCLEISQQMPVAPPLMRTSLPSKSLGLKIDVILFLIRIVRYVIQKAMLFYQSVTIM